VKKSHVRNFSGRPSREKISREKFFWEAWAVRLTISHSVKYKYFILQRYNNLFTITTQTGELLLFIMWNSTQNGGKWPSFRISQAAGRAELRNNA